MFFAHVFVVSILGIGDRRLLVHVINFVVGEFVAGLEEDKWLFDVVHYDHVSGNVATSRHSDMLDDRQLINIVTHVIEVRLNEVLALSRREKIIDVRIRINILVDSEENGRANIIVFIILGFVKRAKNKTSVMAVVGDAIESELVAVTIVGGFIHVVRQADLERFHLVGRLARLCDDDFRFVVVGDGENVATLVVDGRARFEVS